MADSHITPTAEQWEHTSLVQIEVLEVLDRLVKEGVDWRVALTGTSTAIAHLLVQNAGAAEVPVFFARTAAQTMHMAKGG